MSQILQKFRPSGRGSTGWYLILDCGHWYHWTGAALKGDGNNFPCPACKPPMVVMGVPPEAPA